MAEKNRLDPRLASDSLLAGQMANCDIRLMRDARFFWLLLIPHEQTDDEIHNLPSQRQAEIWQLAGALAARIKAELAADRVNLAAIGNIVRQLHLHIVARHEGDAAWPGPVWGRGQAEEPSDALLADRLAMAQRLLADCG